MDTPERIAILLPQDRDEVAALLEEARRLARAAVKAPPEFRRPSPPSSSDPRIQAVRDRIRALPGVRFEAERERAAANAERVAWGSVASIEGRCSHGAAWANCLIRSCPNENRYARGDLRRQVLERDGYRCWYCGRAVLDVLGLLDLRGGKPGRWYEIGSQVNIDHVIPWPEGPTELDNLVTACARCNKEKGADMWDVRPADEL